MNSDLEKYKKECQVKDEGYHNRIKKMEEEFSKAKREMEKSSQELLSLKHIHEGTLSKVKDFREREKDLLHKLEEQKKKLDELQQHNKSLVELPKGVSSLSDLEELELKDLRKLVKCSVCQDRQKDTIISKCCHIFCKECIENNIKTRNRKCPTCKKGFGQDDIKAVWLT